MSETNDDNLPALTGEEAVRDARGRFVKGVVANPKGRGKGTRNWIIEQKLAFESALREYVAHPANSKTFMSAMDNLMRIAAGEGGAEDKDAVAAMKILTDKFMASAPDAPEQAPPPPVVVVIENHTKDVPTVKPVVIIEGEYTDAEPQREAARSDGSREARQLDAGHSD